MGNDCRNPESRAMRHKHVVANIGYRDVVTIPRFPVLEMEVTKRERIFRYDEESPRGCTPKAFRTVISLRINSRGGMTPTTVRISQLARCYS